MDHSRESGDADVAKVEKLLQSWATKICESTNEIITSAMGRGNDFSSPGANAIFDDMRDRQSRIITTIQEAHSRQLEMLKTAVAEERKEFSRAQLIFEQSLKTKYDHVVDALQETIKAEHDARLLRTVKSLESQARLESERAKQAFEIEHEVEVLLAKRLKGIIADLRRSWEVEEAGRMKQMEERLRSNYNVMLEHMEAQLRLALQWQDDADQKWLEELDIRNKKQFDSIRMFEDKCRKLYETRLNEYAEKTNAQIAQYEDKLLEVGSTLASEKAQFESRMRRIKLASSRWKMAYQRDLHERYRALSDALEDRFMGEINGLLNEIKELRTALSDAHRAIDVKEKEIIMTHELHLQGSSGSASLASLGSTSKLRMDLAQRWDELKTPVAERIAMLTALLDSASMTPGTLAVYESVSAKLTDRAPIAQLLNRKQFLEYKLKLSTRASMNDGSMGGGGHTAGGAGGSAGGAGAGMSNSERADLISELAEVKAQTEKLVKLYEKTHNESFVHPAYTGAAGLSVDSTAFATLSPKRT